MSQTPASPATTPTAPLVGVGVGIDVAKANLVIGEHPSGTTWQTPNDEAGIASAVARLAALRPMRVVLEATGGYERQVAAALALAGLPVVVVNPRQVRDFAKATGHLAKTDRLDALVLAHFAAALQPPVRPLPDAATQELAALVERRRQLVAMRSAERSRLASAPTVRVRPLIQTHLAWLDQQIRALDEELDQTLRQSPLWLEDAAIVQSLPGLGPTVTCTLLAGLPEVGHATTGTLAHLVGVAPHSDESGPRHGRRHLGGGRAHVRAALYMATLVATRCNPVIRAYYTHLCTDLGKPKKVALVACMRKLLGIINAMLRHRTCWCAPALMPSSTVA
jgi:transposase